MADAKVCDRCGRYYSKPFTENHFEYPSVKIYRKLENNITPVGSTTDLCPECMDKLLMWLHGEAEIIRNDSMVDISDDCLNGLLKQYPEPLITDIIANFKASLSEDYKPLMDKIADKFVEMGHPNVVSVDELTDDLILRGEPEPESEPI